MSNYNLYICNFTKPDHVLNYFCYGNKNMISKTSICIDIYSLYILYKMPQTLVIQSFT